MEGGKGAHMPQTMERQHGGIVLSVDALTKDCLHDNLATPRFLTHSISLSARVNCIIVIDGGCILSELCHSFQNIL